MPQGFQDTEYISRKLTEEYRKLTSLNRSFTKGWTKNQILPNILGETISYKNKDNCYIERNLGILWVSFVTKRIGWKFGN